MYTFLGLLLAALFGVLVYKLLDTESAARREQLRRDWRRFNRGRWGW